MEQTPSTPPDRAPVLVGWREWVTLPDVGVPWIKAKIDTGARTSALHAFDMLEWRDDRGVARVTFWVNPWQKSAADAVRLTRPVHDRRSVRSSSGHTEQRVVVLLDLVLREERTTAEVTLTSRDEMGFRMLIGREALRQGFVVDSAASYLGGRPPVAHRRRNRGR
ncbi:ATP-dependent zinc protease family protein [Kytococcus aerolatus]